MRGMEIGAPLHGCKKLMPKLMKWNFFIVRVILPSWLNKESFEFWISSLRNGGEIECHVCSNCNLQRNSFSCFSLKGRETGMHVSYYS